MFSSSSSSALKRVVGTAASTEQKIFLVEFLETNTEVARNQ